MSPADRKVLAHALRDALREINEVPAIAGCPGLFLAPYRQRDNRHDMTDTAKDMEATCVEIRLTVIMEGTKPDRVRAVALALAAVRRKFALDVDGAK